MSCYLNIHEIVSRALIFTEVYKG